MGVVKDRNYRQTNRSVPMALGHLFNTELSAPLYQPK
jgi:hypothetical protein